MVRRSFALPVITESRRMSSSASAILRSSLENLTCVKAPGSLAHAASTSALNLLNGSRPAYAASTCSRAMVGGKMRRILTLSMQNECHEININVFKKSEKIEKDYFFMSFMSQFLHIGQRQSPCTRSTKPYSTRSQPPYIAPAAPRMPANPRPARATTIPPIILHVPQGPQQPILTSPQFFYTNILMGNLSSKTFKCSMDR